MISNLLCICWYSNVSKVNSYKAHPPYNQQQNHSHTTSYLFNYPGNVTILISRPGDIVWLIDEAFLVSISSSDSFGMQPDFKYGNRCKWIRTPWMSRNMGYKKQQQTCLIWRVTGAIKQSTLLSTGTYYHFDR